MKKEGKVCLFVDNYGEMLAQVNNLELISFKEDGGYQGEYCAIMSDDERIFYYIDRYGSCSGCDWLEDMGASYQISNDLDEQRVQAEKSYAVPYKEALNYCGELKPRYIVPKNCPLKVRSKGEYNGFSIMCKKDDRTN